ncbi:MAG: hypothetical protein HON90_01605, partial [Halobacteriovoraceae bacterium]|nr:hypothetical protein [Halobacteriovoraceae bacterium]
MLRYQKIIPLLQSILIALAVSVPYVKLAPTTIALFFIINLLVFTIFNQHLFKQIEKVMSLVYPKSHIQKSQTSDINFAGVELTRDKKRQKNDFQERIKLNGINLIKLISYFFFSALYNYCAVTILKTDMAILPTLLTSMYILSLFTTPFWGAYLFQSFLALLIFVFNLQLGNILSHLMALSFILIFTGNLTLLTDYYYKSSSVKVRLIFNIKSFLLRMRSPFIIIISLFFVTNLIAYPEQDFISLLLNKILASKQSNFKLEKEKIAQAQKLKESISSKIDITIPKDLLKQSNLIDDQITDLMHKKNFSKEDLKKYSDLLKSQEQILQKAIASNNSKSNYSTQSKNQLRQGHIQKKLSSGNLSPEQVKNFTKSLSDLANDNGMDHHEKKQLIDKFIAKNNLENIKADDIQLPIKEIIKEGHKTELKDLQQQNQSTLKKLKSIKEKKKKEIKSNNQYLKKIKRFIIILIILVIILVIFQFYKKQKTLY